MQQLSTTRSYTISLAQHSYFNLAGHNSPNRILDHTLQMNCSEYTPVDNTSIPTRQVQKVDNAMSFCEKKTLGDALEVYAVEKAGIEQALAKDMVQQVMEGSSDSIANEEDSPYGFDHNYIIDEDSRAYRSPSEGEDDNLHLAAILTHPPTQRSLHVLTSVPGIQLYTSNYLDGKTPPPALCKDGASYLRWQGICLETQTYPDSIYPDNNINNDNDKFSKGRCFILRPGGPEYNHIVQYEFHNIMNTATE